LPPPWPCPRGCAVRSSAPMADSPRRTAAVPHTPTVQPWPPPLVQPAGARRAFGSINVGGISSITKLAIRAERRERSSSIAILGSHIHPERWPAASVSITKLEKAN
jgi:hypothetical protein